MKRPVTNRIISALLVLVMVLSMIPAVTAVDATTATLVTDISTLKAGDQVIIASGEFGYALGTNQKSNNREAVAVTVADGVLTYGDTVQVLTLAAGTVEGTWAFSTGDGYLYAAGQSKANGASSNQNWLRTQAELDANGSFALTIASDGTATAVAQGTNGCNILQYNNGTNKLFSCYSSASQKAFQIYKVDAAAEGPGEVTPPVTTPAPTEPVVPEATTKYEKVASVADGDVVLLYNADSGKLLSSTPTSYYLAGVDATPADNIIATDETTVVWTVAVNEGVYSFTQGEKMLATVSSGKYFNLTTNATDSTGWILETCNAANNSFYVYSSTLEGTYGHVYAEWYASKTGFSAYSTGADRVEEKAYGFQFYKLVEEEVEPPVEPPVTTPAPTTTAAPEPPVTEPEVTISTIAQALAGESGAEFTVKGVVTMVDGKNIYIQDETDAMCVYMSAVPSDIVLRDTIIATGTRGTFKGLEQLSGGTYKKSEGLTLTAVEKTIAELTSADVAHYITIKGLEITAVNGGVLTLKDEAGNEIVTYKSVLGDTVYAVGDKIDFTGALGIYNETLQLRNTLATEIVKTGSNPVEPPVVDPPVVEPEVNTVAEALAGENGTEFTVKGVVTLVDGQNIYVQDATGGICVRMPSKPSDIALGDTVIGTGSKTVYSGLPQLGSGSYEKSEGLTLEAKEVSDLSTLTNADIGCYIKLVNMEIVEVYDNNGSWSSPNITVKDANGKQIQLYKAVTTKTDGAWDWKIGDKVNISGGMSVYNDKLQLRNTLATEIEEYVPVQTGKVTSADKFETGSYVMVVSTGMAPGVLDGTWVTSVQPVIEGNQCTDAKGGIYTLTVNGSSVEICDPNGVVIAPLDGKNGIQGAAYQWTWAFDEATGTFNFSNQDGSYILASNKGSEGKFRAYKAATANGNPNSYPHDFTLYRVDPTADKPEAESPIAGNKVVIYNISAQGVLAGEGDNQVITNALATVTDGKATAANGAVIFTIEQNGEYFRFYNETYGYLCSNGTGNNAFYALEASDDADWKLTPGKKGGYNLESRTAKFNGKYSQYLEYYSDSYKSYSMYNVTDYDIYEFFFYPCANEKLTGSIVNEPQFIVENIPDAYLGADYVLDAQVDAVFGTESITAGGYTVASDELGLHISVTAAQIEAFKADGKFDIVLKGVDTKGVAFEKTVTVAIKDEPQIGAVNPASGSETGSNKKPAIEAVVTNAGEGATVTMTINGQAVDAAIADGKVTYTPAENLADGRTTVVITVTRADGKTVEKTWTFTVGKAQYQLYFGQLHSHTTYSDGSGSLASALEYIKNLPDSANVDFVAFTDHSNYFDSKTAANPEAALYDRTQATADSLKLWDEYVGAMKDFNASQSDIIAVPGFEMTWSGGPGHINTFNTPGIVSRNNSVLNNKTSDAGMKAYYKLLSSTELSGSISQFNHPGSTFGTFSDFAYYDPVIDSRIFLVEVGNGEGQIGAGGYFPSYEYYTMALDKGWHVAPTNNQDNHKGKWGNGNDARDVILTDDFSLEGLYAAIRQMRVYATEDKNLEIYYNVNGYLLGSTIDEVPEKLNINVVVSDPDKADSISKVEVIVNSGKVAHTWSNPADLASGELSVELDPIYSYYYIRVTQGDGDLAVTAPVWVGETLMLGISEVKCGTSTPVTGEELTLTTTLFNSESTAATVKSLTYAIKGGAVIGTDTTGYTVDASGTKTIDFKYTPDKAKVTTITVTAVVEQDGVEYIFTKDIQLDVENADNLVYIGIDASHYNEYVAGNYKDNMGNFSALAAEYSIRTVELKTSEDLIAACANPKYKALILTAPSRRSSEAQNSNPLKVYTADEIAAITAFNKAGGIMILAGWSDHYENYPEVPSIAGMKAEEHMAATQNAVLEALGSCLRIADDATYDNTLNGGQEYRLYFNTYGDNVLTQGVEVDPENPNDRLYTEVFSQYGGASIYVNGSSAIPGTVSPVVFGHATTYSTDRDGDGLGGDNVPKYAYAEGDNRLMVMAYEQLPGQGMIIVSGAAFMSNFEVQATIEDSGSEKNYSNYRICQNILELVNPVKVSDIADVQSEAEEGVKFTIEGVITSNASGHDKDTAFFDCIYLQDDTAGINAFPVAGEYKIGDKVRITGTTSSYQGERQIAVETIELISEGNTVEAQEVTANQINDRSMLGSLVTLKGKVISFEKANGLVQTIMVKDANGNVARVFIDGYITTAEDVKNLKVGCNVTVTGCASYDDTFNAPNGPFARIRIRNRADIVCTAASDPTNPGTGDATNILLLTSAMILSLAALFGAAYLPRRKENV